MDESAGLENRYMGNRIVGSNPTLSATHTFFRPMKHTRKMSENRGVAS